MIIKIIAGRYGGRLLKTPGGFRTHPMSERARGAVFNSLANWLGGAIVLDAFAGTGVLGLEAVSRGASRAVLVEKDRRAQSAIEENVAVLGVEENVQLIKGGLGGWLEKRDDMFDLIFSDPPYDEPQWKLVRELVGRLKDGGKLVVSRAKGGEAPVLEGVRLVGSKVYAEAAIDIYEKN